MRGGVLANKTNNKGKEKKSYKYYILTASTFLQFITILKNCLKKTDDTFSYYKYVSYIYQGAFITVWYNIKKEKK